MAANFSNLCRDLIGGSLSIKGKLVIDEFCNITSSNTISAAQFIGPYCGNAHVGQLSAKSPATSIVVSSNIFSDQIFTIANVNATNIHTDLLQSLNTGFITVNGSLEPIQNEVFNLGTQTNRWQELFSTNVNCDLLQTVTTGFLHLNGSLEPLFDNIYNLGTMANNWQDTFTTNLNCDILQTISTGFIHVNGSLEPFDDKLFDLGSNVAAWSSLHVENINFCGNIFDINGSQVITTRQNPVSPPVPSVAFDYNRGNLSPNNTGNIAMSPLTSEVQSELVKIQNEINGNIEILRQTVDDLINKLQVHGLIG